MSDQRDLVTLTVWVSRRQRQRVKMAAARAGAPTVSKYLGGVIDDALARAERDNDNDAGRPAALSA